ncbi:hypothetical protein DPMN_075028 [Dreissena polymorpha]|uniref:Uncharacterized protein n=2 Tax=Dreissena polymorpha TaxID=45954 RepID=A0A9D3YKB4_DREPO|nr:hypothetical protein DPMN_075028 [Dreissena polymorpha]
MFKNSKNSVRSKVDDSRSTGHGRVDFSIEEEIVAGILRDRNPHQLDGIPGGMESTFEKENRPPKEGQPSSSTATCSVQKYSPPAAVTTEPCSSGISNGNVLYEILLESDVSTGVTPEKNRGKKSMKKRKVDVEEELYDLESRRITSEIRAWEAKKIYYENKIVQEKEIHELNKILILKQIDNFLP